MSTKVIAVAAVAAAACIATTEAYSMQRPSRYPMGRPLDKDQVQIHWDPPAYRPLDEESTQDLKDTFRKATLILNKAQELGLFEEEQQDFVQQKGLKKPLQLAARVFCDGIGFLAQEQKVRLHPSFCKQRLWDEDEDEEQLTVNGGVEGGPDGLKWRVGFEHTFEEDQEQRWGSKLASNTKKPIILAEAQADESSKNSKNSKRLTILDEDEEQLTIDGGIEGGPRGIKWRLGLKHKFDEEETQTVLPPRTPHFRPILWDEDEEQFTIDGHVEGGPDGVKWGVGFKHTFDEDQEQRLGWWRLP